MKKYILFFLLSVTAERGVLAQQIGVRVPVLFDNQIDSVMSLIEGQYPIPPELGKQIAISIKSASFGMLDAYLESKFNGRLDLTFSLLPDERTDTPIGPFKISKMYLQKDIRTYIFDLQTGKVTTNPPN